VAADAARAAAAAREAASRERFQAGVAIMADVLDAQSNLTAAETTQINARAAAWLAAATLDRVVGR
jgi:outer membrane protein TolC